MQGYVACFRVLALCARAAYGHAVGTLPCFWGAFTSCSLSAHVLSVPAPACCIQLVRGHMYARRTRVMPTQACTIRAFLARPPVARLTPQGATPPWQARLHARGLASRMSNAPPCRARGVHSLASLSDERSEFSRLGPLPLLPQRPAPGLPTPRVRGLGALDPSHDAGVAFRCARSLENAPCIECSHRCHRCHRRLHGLQLSGAPPHRIARSGRAKRHSGRAEDAQGEP